EIEQLDLTIGEVELKTKGALRNLASSPQFDDFTIRSANLDPAVLLRYYPAARASLPEGTRLAGPITLSVIASGDADRQRVQAEIDLANLDVFYPGTLVKKPGVPMGIS